MTEYNKKIAELKKTAKEGEHVPDPLSITAATLVAEEENSGAQAVVGTKEAFISQCTEKVGLDVLGSVVLTADGNRQKSVNDIQIYDILQAILDGADRQPYGELLQNLNLNVLGFVMDFRKKIPVNVNNLNIKASKLKEVGIPIGYPIKTLILLANVEAVVGEKWAFHFIEALRNIKDKHPYNKVHDENSFKEVVEELSKVDERRTLKDAPAPEVANAVEEDSPAYQALLAAATAAAETAAAAEEYSYSSEEEGMYEEASAVGDTSSNRGRGSSTARSRGTSSSRGSSTSRSKQVKKKEKEKKTISKAQMKKNINCPHCKRNGRDKGIHPYISPDKCHLNPDLPWRPRWAHEMLFGALDEDSDDNDE